MLVELIDPSVLVVQDSLFHTLKKFVGITFELLRLQQIAYHVEVKSTLAAYEHLFKIDAALRSVKMKPLGSHLSNVSVKDLTNMIGTGTRSRDIRYSIDIASLRNIRQSEYDVFMAFV